MDRSPFTCLPLGTVRRETTPELPKPPTTASTAPPVKPQLEAPAGLPVTPHHADSSDATPSPTTLKAGDVAVWQVLYPRFRTQVASDLVIEASNSRKRSPEADNTPAFACAIGCGATFTTRGKAIAHGKRHCGIKKFKCKFTGCDSSFVASGDARRHERTCRIGKALPKSSRV